MVKITVNDVEYNVPTKWEDITVQQQIEITEVANRDETFRNLHMISTYTGIPLELVKKMNINQFKSVLNLMKFLAEPIENKVVSSFTFNGKTYQVADSLLKGETQDFLSIEGILKKYKDNQSKALPYIIAIVAKQQGETLDSFDVHKRAEEFKNLPYTVANNIWFFFAQTERVLSISTKQYLAIQDKVLEESLSYTESMLKQSDGQGLYKRLLRTSLLWYIKSIRKSWTNFLTSTQSESSTTNSNQKSKKSRLKSLVEKVRSKFKTGQKS